MTTTEFASALALLDTSAEPSVARFDDGPPLAGQVAVLPSAFNPPTLAHLHLLETALASGCDQAAALLTTRNVAKEVFGAGLPDRVGMLLALRDARPELLVLATNAARFVDQAAALRNWAPAATFDFVAGYDTLVRLFDVRYYADMPAELRPFFERHRVIATNRGDYGLDAVEEFLQRPEVLPFAGRILARQLDDHPASFSSTAARETVARGDHPEILPAPVAAYIRAHGLYAGD